MTIYRFFGARIVARRIYQAFINFCSDPEQLSGQSTDKYLINPPWDNYKTKNSVDGHLEWEDVPIFRKSEIIHLFALARSI